MQPKYKVNQKVIVSSSNQSENSLPVGEVVTIEFISANDGEFRYFCHGENNQKWMLEWELKPLTYKYRKVGEKVKVVTHLGNAPFPIGEVVTVEDISAYSGEPMYYCSLGNKKGWVYQGEVEGLKGSTSDLIALAIDLIGEEANVEYVRGMSELIATQCTGEDEDFSVKASEIYDILVEGIKIS